MNPKLLAELRAAFREPLLRLYLHRAEAAHFGLKDGDRVEQLAGMPVVKIVMPLPEATSPGRIINRASRRK